MTVRRYPLGSRAVTALEVARAWIAFAELREQGQLDALPCSPAQLDAAVRLGWKAYLLADNERRYLSRMLAHPHAFYLGCQEVVDLVRPGRHTRVDPATITSLHEMLTGHASAFATAGGTRVEQWAARFEEALAEVARGTAPTVDGRAAFRVAGAVPTIVTR